MHLLLDDKRDLINARRWATYLKNKENADINKEQMKAPLIDGSRKKHDDAAGKHLHQNMKFVDMSGMQNVTWSALGDIINGVQAESKLVVHKNSQIKALGRATVNHKDDNLPALTSTADPTRSTYTSLSQDEAVLPHTTTITTDVIHDNQLPRKQRDNADDIDGFRDCIMGDETTPSDFMDEEYYMFRGEGSDNDTLEDDEEAIMSSAIPSKDDPLDLVYTNIPDTNHILKLDANCIHCKAKKFVFETDGFCCRSGQIELQQPEPIPELMRLWSSMDADSTHGTIYHNVHSFGPSSRPEHLQLYFFDDDPTITHRKAATKQLDQDVVKKLVDILKENPYSQQFRSLGAHKDNLDD
ncbi:hypothetical protein TRIUR3_12587 [Triticum urartu]|uniref:Helitron helicase-like domain-containing protein n=1 Tax=Triticum urartu TaxID=4572 RepID=M8AH77_TRIUA|nr:hypothetical protein TRIUR3_12587 [Triticum urartu]